jgi:REP element-mobilizing transposase RayT
MAYDPFRHNRKSIRLRGYDYTVPGVYFFTIVTHRRMCIFGEIVNGEMRLNDWGEIAHAEWMKTAVIRPEIAMDEIAIMPNHVHAIITIMENDGDCVGARRRRAPTVEQFAKPVVGSIPTIIRAYKSAVTNRINQSRGTPGAPVWQRNYYEHIIRNDGDYSRIREYIRDNPVQWESDVENRLFNN